MTEITWNGHPMKAVDFAEDWGADGEHHLLKITFTDGRGDKVVIFVKRGEY